MKKCIVISDSFKGSLPSRDICAIARERIPLFFPACEVRALNVADGGEGTVDCFLASCGGERVLVSGVQNPYGEPIDAAYGLLPDGTAVIEMAAAAGLPLVAGRKNPCVTTTYGVGQLIADALARGARRIVLGLGGSATNDGGRGRGDQYVIVDVEIPKKVTRAQREALKAFEDSMKEDNYEKRKGFFKNLRDRFS